MTKERMKGQQVGCVELLMTVRILRSALVVDSLF